MLQNLASYFLGGTSTTNNDIAGGVVNDDTNNEKVTLRTTDHDDGWTMVDRDSEGDSERYSSEEEDNVSQSGLHRVRLDRAGSNESLTRVHDMEESWFVTPPPCFSSQTGPVSLRTSPLENLLIEHPSMSVYQRNGSRHPQLRTPSPTDTAEDELEVEEMIEEEQVPAGSILVVRRVAGSPVAPGRFSRGQALQLSDIQMARNRQAQKVQMKKLAKEATSGHLNRANKAREVCGRNWNPRRKERCQGSFRSHANNNRKC